MAPSLYVLVGATLVDEVVGDNREALILEGGFGEEVWGKWDEGSGLGDGFGYVEHSMGWADQFGPLKTDLSVNRH